jgi:hypothetical protein
LLDGLEDHLGVRETECVRWGVEMCGCMLNLLVALELGGGIKQCTPVLLDGLQDHLAVREKK